MNEVGTNLAAILAAWIETVRGGNTAPLGALLDEHVIWRGLLPEQVCRDRQEVLSVLARNRPRPPRLTRIEATEFGDRVAVAVDGPDFPGRDAASASGPWSLIFTFRDGRIVRMESEPDRDTAFSLAGQPV